MRTTYLCLICLLGLTACGDDFTLLAPESQRNAQTYYDQPTDMEVALNGVYDALQLAGTYSQSYWIMLEMRSDNTDQGADVTGLARELAVINDFQEIPTSEFVGNAWTDSYKGINRANTLLARLDDVEMDAARKERIRGEALFLRSLFYYNLAVLFGNIPLVLEETRSPNQPFEQVPASRIYQQIIADLQAAAERLPASYSGADIGRATKGAALTLLGKVYLTTGDKGTAAQVLRRVVDEFDYQLVENYADLWGPQNENNVESIFEVQYKAGGIGEGSPFTDTFDAQNRPTPDLIAAYEAGDLRKAASITEEGFCAKFPSDPFSQFDADNNFPVLRYADVLLMLAEALGESPEAYALINQVRARAGLAPIDDSTPGTFTEKLLHERQVELAFENHRWPDLLRFGVAESRMAAQGLQARPLFPIPQREIDVAPDVMTQNPGF
ncbi:RagB/SusD family nutrient uptake outer membrane protein [Rhodocaloribacter litoris]|uniref:RagB/SusD family nutrient uptake outer membrane protein n=1 Tax=Rhodocaloribacter litoris TaxID=2558931 RepID=UPI0014246B90|nr:RagB/SusD family nutrient uptake outer membrane protein [Rhodocaloribacter litoris]QXD15375.1 RagB/SusD family nutrient uptake outer membrane protein [Rhodocaloribacter litoris]